MRRCARCNAEVSDNDNFCRGCGTQMTGENNSHTFKPQAEAQHSVSMSGLVPPEILAQGEHPVYETRPLLWPLSIGPIGVIILGLFIVAISGFASQSISGFVRQLELEPYFTQDVAQLVLAIIMFIGIAMLLAGLLRILTRWLRWRYTIYAVTDRRVLRQTGIIGKSYIDCPVSKVQTVYLDIPVLGRIFGYGTIRLATAGAAWVEMQWEGVKQPREAQRVLNEVIQQASGGTG